MKCLLRNVTMAEGNIMSSPMYSRLVKFFLIPSLLVSYLQSSSSLLLFLQKSVSTPSASLLLQFVGRYLHSFTQINLFLV